MGTPTLRVKINHVKVRGTRVEIGPITSGWTSERWAEVGAEYFDEHESVGTGADARGPALLIIDRQPEVWRVRQISRRPGG